MNRYELLCRYDAISRELQLDQPVLVSGAAMVVHRLYRTCDEIDLAVMRPDFYRLAKLYPVTESLLYERGCIIIPELGVSVALTKSAWTYSKYPAPLQEGALTMPARYLTPRGLEAMKREMVECFNREQDRQDLVLIQQTITKDGRFR